MKRTLAWDCSAFSRANPTPQCRHTKGRVGSAGGGGGEGGEGGERGERGPRGEGGERARGGEAGGRAGLRTRRDHCCVRADVMFSHTPAPFWEDTSKVPTMIGPL